MRCLGRSAGKYNLPSIYSDDAGKACTCFFDNAAHRPSLGMNRRSIAGSSERIDHCLPRYVKQRRAGIVVKI